MEFESVIGLEIHIEMSTKTKMFCGCSNDNFGAKPNTNVCPICMGFPGMLPVPNKETIKKGAIAAMALKCKINKHSKFDRKNYFYPDLPLGFQISQYDEPLSQNGELNIVLDNGKEKKIGITRLHIENDAGKLTHIANGTLVDFNRAGKPLMEIVSEPDMRSAKEAKEYAEVIQKLIRYAGSSDCDMEKGQMRFDASVSIRPKGEAKLYPRAEIKNLNSFRSLESAIEYEIQRQIGLWNKNDGIKGEQTLGWDENKGETYLLRDKESAADYRYFPEPDIPPMDITEEMITKWKKEVPESPVSVMLRFKDTYGLKDAEAKFFSEDAKMAKLFEEVAIETKNGKAAASFIGTILISKLKEKAKRLNEAKITKDHLIELIKLVDKNQISNNVAKGDIFEEMMETGKMPSAIIKEKGIMQLSGEEEIKALCEQAILENAQAVSDVKAGKTKAMATIIGSVMKISKGRANPKLVNEILAKLLV